MSRIFIPALLLLAAAGLPYLSSEWSKSAPPLADVSTNAWQHPSVAGIQTASVANASNTFPALPTKPQLAEPPLVDIAEAIRFEVTASWVISRWPRVTAGLPDGELQGYRVPLVTGTRHDDVAGSLTYYFNAQQACQRITLQGVTGDPRKIALHIVNSFGLARQMNTDPGLELYQTRWNGKAVSELKIKTMPVVKADAPHARYNVELSLNNRSRSPLQSILGR